MRLRRRITEICRSFLLRKKNYYSLLLFLICFNSICAKPFLLQAYDKSQDSIVVQQIYQPKILNPIISNDAEPENVNGYIFETLLSIDKKNYELIPNIATKLPEISEDHLSYTFELNEHVTFSDGYPLTGEDIIFTIKAIKNLFVNTDALKNYFNNLKSVELINDNKYKVKFVMGRAYFRNLYTLADLKILPRHIFDKDNILLKIAWKEFEKSEGDLSSATFQLMKKAADIINSQVIGNEVSYLIGSGRYIFEKCILGSTIYLKKNESYWNKASRNNYIDRIIFKVTLNNDSDIEDMLNHKLDFMHLTNNKDYFEPIQNYDNYSVNREMVIEPLYTYIGWNNKNIFFSDKKIRWAMSYAIDRESIISEQLYNSAKLVQSHIFIKNEYYNTNLELIHYDLEKAKKLLTEAGWVDTDQDGVIDKIINGEKVNFKFTYLSTKNPKRIKILDTIIQSLEKLGIKASIKNYEWGEFLNNLQNHDFEAFLGTWQLNVTPDDPYQIWHSSQVNYGSNQISYINSESDKLLEENQHEFDEKKRIQILNKWQELIYNDQPVTFLWSEKAKYLYSNRFKNTNFYEFTNPVNFNEWQIRN